MIFIRLFYLFHRQELANVGAKKSAKAFLKTPLSTFFLWKHLTLTKIARSYLVASCGLKIFTERALIYKIENLKKNVQKN